ncbi:MAG: hypothetical protein K0S54_1035 [Alphaproteobacteria bacterium]|nr:hypothetical protein [Alphaproteobacteria bacterium]
MVHSTIRATFEAVLPLHDAGDSAEVARAVRQGRTLRELFSREQLLRINVVAAGSELPHFAEHLWPLQSDWLQYRFFDLAAVSPGLDANPADFRRKAQIARMAGGDWLGVRHWLALDARIACVRKFGIADLFAAERALMDVRGVTVAEAGQAWATRQVLGMVAPPATFACGTLPQIYATPIMRALQEIIRSLHGRPWIELLLDEEAAGHYRRTGASWSEAMLYYAVAARTGMLRRMHALSGIDTPHRLAAIFDADAGSALPDQPDQRPLATPQSSPAPLALTASPAPLADDAFEQEATPTYMRARILCHEPLLVWGAQDRTGLANLLRNGVMEPFRAVPALVLVSLPSSREAPHDMLVLAAAIARRRRELPQHTILVLCNTECEVNGLRELGVDCVLANHNLFLDERPFLAAPEVQPEFDAVYNAGFHPAKRHRLAADIASLALIFPNWHDEYVEYAAESKRSLAHAVFLNQPTAESEYQFFDRNKLAAQLARARVGLCLSDIEGSMRASIEYLFAGLPIVSTLNRGGRDQFFDADVCVTVPPSPKLIAEAVRELIRLDLPRSWVRQRTMHKLASHRERLIAAVQQAMLAMGCERMPKVDWPWLVEARGHYSIADFHKAAAR